MGWGDWKMDRGVDGEMYNEKVFKIPVLCSMFQRFAPYCYDPCVFPRLTGLFG